jgi:hypothetical protein
LKVVLYVTEKFYIIKIEETEIEHRQPKSPVYKKCVAVLRHIFFLLKKEMKYGKRKDNILSEVQTQSCTL